MEANTVSMNKFTKECLRNKLSKMVAKNQVLFSAVSGTLNAVEISGFTNINDTHSYLMGV